MNDILYFLTFYIKSVSTLIVGVWLRLGSTISISIALNFFKVIYVYVAQGHGYLKKKHPLE